MAYARKSGFGGDTGDLLKGARVIRINQNYNVFKISTWLRDFDGYLDTQDKSPCNRVVDPTLKPNSSEPVQPWTA